ncbi:GntR family transcriptional regulator [Solitalea longa]|uniref:GntR family transcriptional regulator n=1 Tax=Solitalea longa TaxID=2079460 RepID=A0A2S4ZZQ2_9SPHI|nr:rhamnogalacturonan acetylesterase [Solitalea longa]POY35838.1 GntR family transcriptional regulator [Solitalea longa]
MSVFLLMSFRFTEEKRITVYLIGDSTMSIKEPTAYPETGWGMPFAVFFDSTVVVDNRAKNGRSTRTFISENRWQSVADQLKEGDYVFIQFGHNDESKEKVDRYTSPQDFKANLSRFVNETRAHKANPILITPVARRRFDNAGKVLDSHGEYGPLVRSLAAELNVPLIDLQKESEALLQEFGKDQSALLFLQLQPGEHPNYPLGKIDNTHFNELGARKIAQLVLANIKAQHIPLENHIVKK